MKAANRPSHSRNHVDGYESLHWATTDTSRRRTLPGIITTRSSFRWTSPPHLCAAERHTLNEARTSLDQPARTAFRDRPARPPTPSNTPDGYPAHQYHASVGSQQPREQVSLVLRQTGSHNRPPPLRETTSQKQNARLTFFPGLRVKLPFSFVSAPDTLSPTLGLRRWWVAGARRFEAMGPVPPWP